MHTACLIVSRAGSHEPSFRSGWEMPSSFCPVPDAARWRAGVQMPRAQRPDLRPMLSVSRAAPFSPGIRAGHTDCRHPAARSTACAKRNGQAWSTALSWPRRDFAAFAPLWEMEDHPGRFRPPCGTGRQSVSDAAAAASARPAFITPGCQGPAPPPRLPPTGPVGGPPGVTQRAKVHRDVARGPDAAPHPTTTAGDGARRGRPQRL